MRNSRYPINFSSCPSSMPSPPPPLPSSGGERERRDWVSAAAAARSILIQRRRRIRENEHVVSTECTAGKGRAGSTRVRSGWRKGEERERERVNFLRVGSSWVGCWGHSLSLLLPPLLLFVRTVSACAWFPGYFRARVTLCVFLVN